MVAMRPNLKSALFPVQSPFNPDITKADAQNYYEQQHFDETEHAEFLEQNRPGKEKYSLNIKENKQNGNQIKLDRKPLMRRNDLLFTALKRLHFFRKMPFGAKNGSHKHHAAGDPYSHGQHDSGANVLF